MAPALDVLGPLAFWLFLAITIAQLGRQDAEQTARMLADTRAARARRRMIFGR